jgi:adenylate cyclase
VVLRVGVNLGDVIVDGDDIQGDGVNVATRMQEIAPPGGVAVSGLVYDSVHDKLPVTLEDLGAQRVKNIAEPVRAYRLAGPRTTAAAPDVDWEAVPARRYGQSRVFSILSSNRRTGVWRVPRRLQAVAVMGSLELDLRGAEFEPGVTEIDVLNVMGSVEIIVPTGIAVECDGIGVLGNFDSTNVHAERTGPDAPVLRIRGIALMGHTATS